jgi:hypothetical protein
MAMRRLPRRVGGTLATPHAGLAQGRTSDMIPSPLRSYAPAVKEMSAPNSGPISRLFNRRSAPPHLR